MRSFHILLFVGLLVFGSVAAAGASSSPCRGTGSGARMLSTYRWTAILSDSSANDYRASVGLFAVDSSQVLLVSDTTVCRAALKAYNAALSTDSVQSVAVDVIKYGTTRYIVADSARIGRSEWTPAVVFSTAFQVIAQVGQ